MPRRLQVRELSEQEYEIIQQIARSRTAAVRQVERAGIIQASHEGQSVAEIASGLQLKEAKVLRSLALQGRRFETWDEVCAAVQSATAYWNAHRHPFVWGKHRRHRSRRQSGIGSLPNVS